MLKMYNLDIARPLNSHNLKSLPTAILQKSYRNVSEGCWKISGKHLCWILPKRKQIPKILPKRNKNGKNFFFYQKRNTTKQSLLLKFSKFSNQPKALKSFVVRSNCMIHQGPQPKTLYHTKEESGNKFFLKYYDYTCVLG